MRRLRGWLEGIGVGLTVVAVCLFTLIVILRVLLPDLSNRKAEIETYLSEKLEAKVSIGGLSLHFIGVEPKLELENVAIEKNATRLKANRVVARMHMMQSLVANGWRVLHFPMLDVLFGSLELDDTQLSQDHNTLFLHTIKTDLNYKNIGDEVSLMLSRLTIEKDRTLSMPAFFVKLSMISHDNGVSYAIQGKDIPLDVGYLLEPVLPQLHQNEAFIKGLHPQGMITQFAAEFTDELHFFSLTLRDFAMQAYHGAPGVSGANVHIDYAPGKGRLTFLSEGHEPTMLSLPTVFKAPFYFTALTGDIYFWPDADHWIVQTDNLDAKTKEARILSSFTYDNAGGGQLSLKTKMEGDVLPLRNLVPVTLESDSYTWLSQAFVSGRVHAADILFEGQLKDYPFLNHEGTLLFSAAADDVTLQFDPDWPVLSHINGSVWGNACTLDIDVPMGETQNAQLKQVTANLNNMCTPAPMGLRVQGQAIGQLQDALQYLLNSPLKKDLGEAFQPLKPEGPMQLSLNLNLEISKKGVSSQVDGAIDTEMASMVLPESPTGLRQIKGTFLFTDESLKSPLFTAKFADMPVSGSIVTHTVKGLPEAVIKATAHPSVAQLEKAFHTPLSDKIQGQTEVLATVIIPFKSATPPTLTFESNLMGLSILLPAPFNKTKTESKAFVAEPIFVHNEIAGWQLGYNKQISIALGKPKHNAPYPVIVFFGQKRLEIPTEPGLYIEGTLPELSVNDMSAFSGDQKNTLPFVGANIMVNTLKVGDSLFKNVNVALTKASDHITVYLNSSDLAGAIRLSQQGVKNGTKIALDRLKITSSVESSLSKVKPDALSDLLPIQLSVNQLSLDTTKLGKISLYLSTALTPKGISIQDLVIQGPLLSLSGQGHWAQTQTELQGKLDTRSLGQLLRVFADTKFLERAPGSFNYALSWPGAPMDFALKNASGSIDLQLKEGQLLGVEPGLGRLFSLLSIDEWQRRIKLNFNDVVNQGFAFDWIRGSFKLTSGNAITEATSIKGSAADMTMKGQMDFAQSKLNLDVLVTPNVNAGLPIAAAVAAANPAVGAAVWIFDKILSPKLGTLARNRYLVQGDFKDPKITQVTLKSDPVKIEKNGKRVR